MLLVHDREDPGHARQFDCCDVIFESGMPNGPACFPSSLLIILQSRCRLMALGKYDTPTVGGSAATSYVPGYVLGTSLISAQSPPQIRRTTEGDAWRNWP